MKSHWKSAIIKGVGGVKQQMNGTMEINQILLDNDVWLQLQERQQTMHIWQIFHLFI